MHPAPHPRPVRVIVEIDPGQVSSLVQQLVARFTTPSPLAPPGRGQGQAPRPKPDPDDEDDDAPAPARRGKLPPPVAHSPPLDPRPGQAMPTLPDHVSQTRVLGKPCHKNHRYQNSAYTLRKRSNRGCVACERERDLAHKRARKAVPGSGFLVPGSQPATTNQGPETQPGRRAVVTTLPTTNGARPELPSHWEGRAFLSPVLCSEPRHRFRASDYTLRYLESELCVQCCTDANPALALAGD